MDQRIGQAAGQPDVAVSAAATGVGADCVTILMGLYNGAAHLDAQLQSIAGQDHGDWRLILSDDGSRDDTMDRAQRFAESWPQGRVTLLQGPRQGFAGNYLAMLRNLPQPAGWLAFADQDDVWLPDKMGRAMAALRAAVADPERDLGLYCSRTWIVGDDLGGRRLSRARPRPPGFLNALVQNIAAGNTIVVTPAAARLLAAAAWRTGAVVAHDWWAYQLITGAGGVVVHDDRPSLLYRQHGGNSIGSNDGLRSKLARIGMLVNGTMRGWTETNLAALRAVEDWLTPEAREAVLALEALRAEPRALQRLRLFLRLRLYRQSLASTVALWVAALTRRL